MDTTRHTDTHAAATFWDEHYRARGGGWGGRANPILVETAEPLVPGTALDLGCGTGGDTVWLARHGWQVTAADISAVAVEGVRQCAREFGIAERVVAEQHDLAATFPAGEFDLVSAQYFHTPFETARSQVLRTGAHALRPGGVLLIVDHGSAAPWSWNQDPDARFPAPAEIAAGLELDPEQWSVLRADAPCREATGPAGETATLIDNVLVLGRAAG